MDRKIVLLASTWILIAGCSAASHTAPVTDGPPPAQTTVAPPPPVVAPAAAPNSIVLSLELDPVPAQQSGTVQVSGRGFSAGETVAISASKSEPGSEILQLAQTTANGSGTVDALQVALPDELKSGPHTIQAVGDTSGRQSNGTLWIRAPQAWVVLGAYDVQQYGDFGFIAGGFEPMEQVSAVLKPSTDSTGTPVQLTTFTTDQAGNAEWTQVKLPALGAGAYTLVLSGQAGGQQLKQDLTVKPLTPDVELSPWAGPPGANVQFNARGFAPSERVSVFMGDGTQQAGELQADEYGNLWGAGPVRVPQSAAAGPLTLHLLGQESGARAAPDFSVTAAKPWLELTSWWGAPGSPVGFSGGGWIAGERVTFHLGNAGGAPEGQSQADDNGWLHPADVVYVPTEAASDVTFVAVGEMSGKTASATFKVVLPFGLRPDPSNKNP
ncbi:MAG: hypothetical protein JOZ81_32455 [Chloroflexi bacterium]|nr:hypothetical protein [Chloroflexota bacterium]